MGFGYIEAYKHKKQVDTLEEIIQENNTRLDKAFQETQALRNNTQTAQEKGAFVTLTQGIAHEIRNPMGMMLASIELMAENLDNKEKMGKYCKIIKDNILRLSQVTSTMLKYGISNAHRHISYQDISTLLENAITLSKAACEKRKIKLIYTPTKLPPVPIDNYTLPQSFLNIILNAIEAIKEDGKIVISCKKEAFTNESNEKRLGIKIEFKDNGPGIPEKIKANILKPFFTSKTANTGIGLNMTKNTIDAHGGKLTVESTLGNGCTVNIYLPQNPPKKVQDMKHKQRLEQVSQ